MTDAYTQVGNYGEAVHSLLDAEQLAPEEVRCRPLSHRLIEILFRTTKGEPARMLRGVAHRAGLPA